MFDDQINNHNKGELTSGIRNRTVTDEGRRRWVIVLIVLALLIGTVFAILYIRSERKLLKVEKQLEQAQVNPAAKVKE